MKSILALLFLVSSSHAEPYAHIYTGVTESYLAIGVIAKTMDGDRVAALKIDGGNNRVHSLDCNQKTKAGNIEFTLRQVHGGSRVVYLEPAQCYRMAQDLASASDDSPIYIKVSRANISLEAVSL